MKLCAPSDSVLVSKVQLPLPSAVAVPSWVAPSNTVTVLLASALYTALASTLVTLAAVLGAHPPRSASLISDLRASVGIALIAGAVYALYFGAASLLGKRGTGRKWALIIDFVLGAGSSALAAPWPRGHVRNLLGGEPVVDLSQASAWFVLGAIGVVCVTLSVAKTAE